MDKYNTDLLMIDYLVKKIQNGGKKTDQHIQDVKEKIIEIINQMDACSFMTKFIPFQKLEILENPQPLRIDSAAGTTFSENEKSQIVGIFESNMKQLYLNSSWGYNLDEKTHELFHQYSRYLVAKVDENTISAFVHFRFCMDDDYATLYV